MSLFRILIFFAAFFSGFGSLQAQWLPVGSLIGTGDYGEHLSFPSPSVGYVITEDHHIRKTANGGATWSTVYTPGELTGQEIYYFEDIVFLTPDKGFAVGWDFLAIDYLILQTNDGGANWLPFIFSDAFSWSTCNAVDFPTSATGYVVGSLGLILKTTDGGANWSDIHLPLTNNLIDVDFIDAQDGWILSADSKLFRTTNGGADFTTLPTPVPFVQIQMLSATIGFATAGGTIYKTTNGGASWSSVGEIPENGIEQFQMLTAEKGFAISGSTIIKTNDGGQNWLLQEFKGAMAPGDVAVPTDFHMFDAETGVATSRNFHEATSLYSGQLLTTANGGGVGAAFKNNPSYIACPNQAGSIELQPQYDGAPNVFEWKLDGAFFSAAAVPPAIVGPFIPGIHTISLRVSKGNNSVQMSRTFTVEGQADYGAESSLSVGQLPCIGTPFQIRVNNWYHGTLQVALLLNGQIVDGPKLLNNTFGENYFNVPPAYDTLAYTMVVYIPCGAVPVETITVPVRQLADLSLPVEVLGDTLLCRTNNLVQVKISNTDPNTLYNIYQNGVQSNTFEQSGTGGDLVFNSNFFDSTTVIQIRATDFMNGCPAYLHDSVIVTVERPDARFAVSGINFPFGTPVSVKFEGQEAVAFDWQFGSEATPSTATSIQPPPVNYSNLNAGEIRLIVTAQGGCRDTFVRQVGFYDPGQLDEFWAMEINASDGAVSKERIALDADRHIWCTGKSQGAISIPSMAGTNSVQNQSLQILLLKYDTYGVLKKHLAFDGIGDDHVRALGDIATDADNNLYVAMNMNTFHFDETTIFPSADEKPRTLQNYYGSAIAKYNPAGEIQWIAKVHTCDGAGLYAVDLAVDANNNLLVLGQGHNLWNCSQDISIIEADGSLTTFPGNSESFLIRFNPAGQVTATKNFLNQANPGFILTYNSLKPDAQGNLFVSGYGIPFLAKFDAQLNPVWGLSLPTGANGTSISFNSLEVDPAGNTYLAGNFRAALHLPGIPPLIPADPAPDKFHLYVCKISPQGQVLWAKTGNSDGSYTAAPALEWQGGSLWISGSVVQNVEYQGHVIGGDAEETTHLLKLSDSDGHLENFMAQGQDGPDPYNWYRSYGQTVAVNDLGNAHWLGNNGYECTFDNTVLNHQNWLFLAKISELSVAVKEPFLPGMLSASVQPNPSAQATSVRFTLEKAIVLKATATNVLGQSILLWNATSFAEGEHSIPLEFAQKGLLPGIWYISMIDGNGKSITLPFVLMP